MLARKIKIHCKIRLRYDDIRFIAFIKRTLMKYKKNRIIEATWNFDDIIIGTVQLNCTLFFRRNTSKCD